MLRVHVSSVWFQPSAPAARPAATKRGRTATTPSAPDAARRVSDGAALVQDPQSPYTVALAKARETLASQRPNEVKLNLNASLRFLPPSEYNIELAGPNRICDWRDGDEVGEWEIKPDRNDSTERFLDYAGEVPSAFPLGCLECATRAQQHRFVRSQCHRPSVYDLGRLIQDRVAKLFFVGDSVLDQMYKGFRWVSKQNNDQVRMMPMLESHIWCCMPETHFVLDNAFIGQGILGSSGGVRDLRNEVLVLSFGNWYRMDATFCSCLPENDLRGCSKETAPPWAAKEWHQCIFERTTGKKFGWTQCANIRIKTCRHRRLTNWLNHCGYRKDLLRLSRYLTRNKNELPQYVFFVENGATHKKLGKADADWRSAVAEPIIKKYAPHVTYIKQFAVLKDRWDSHCVLPGTQQWDPWHWCYHSPAFEEYLGNLLSSIAARLQSPPPP